MLKERNIGSSVHFIPLHKHTLYKKRFQNNKFPIANNLFAKIVSIPMFPSMTDEDVEYVINNINHIIEGL
jgi:dTDP-4-amino-4,6-dideoxygalactose transaminase